MMIGGPAHERTGDLLWIGWAYGTLQLVLFVALLAPGFTKAALRGGAAKAILWGGGLLYVALFTLVMFQYRGEISVDGHSPGLPNSTWTAIFVLWPCPYLFIAAYSFGFKRFFYRGAST